MGTGGTLPTNITQTVTLYNTTGVIEKDKGIYFCPFILASTNQTVKEAWLSAFNTEVGLSNLSPYKDMVISQWSPKDRELKVKGNVDDFRAVTEEGESFNYLIVTRTVIKGETSKTFYYGFFITDATQVGNGSVHLSLESDDFTNVFYLHNDKKRKYYSGEYVDVFNERLKNCYVNRQHYNRIKWDYAPVETTLNNPDFTKIEDLDDQTTTLTVDVTDYIKGEYDRLQIKSLIANITADSNTI